MHCSVNIRISSKAKYREKTQFQKKKSIKLVQTRLTETNEREKSKRN